MTRFDSILRNFSRPHWLVAAITLLAAFFRLYRLDQLPPGFYFDQAFNVFDILRLLQGQFAIFFPANTGREPLYFYLSTVGVALVGQTSLALKLTSALIGIATIPLVYIFARRVFKSGLIAAKSALLTAISFWHIFFSRLGLRVILEVPLTMLVFLYLWMAWEKRRPAYFVWTGFFLALALYTYPSARLLPFALILLLAYASWNDRPHTRAYLGGLTLALTVAGILCLPLGIYFYVHPDQFLSHTVQISILAPGSASVNPGLALLGNIQKVGGMFLFSGDGGAIRNLPGRPVFDPLLGILFLVGVGVLLTVPFQSAPARRRGALLATWLGISLASSLFSDDAPNFLRTLPALPAFMILPAWGTAAIGERLRPSARRMGRTVVAGVLVLSTLFTFHDYFITFANLPALYYSFDVDKVEIARWINENVVTHHIFVAPLFYQQGTISLLTHTARLKSFDSRDTIVLPSATGGQDAIFGFPVEQEQRVKSMAARLGGLGTREDLNGSNGARLLWLYRVPASRLPDSQNPLKALEQGGAFVGPKAIEHAVWENQIELLGYTATPEGAGGRNLTVTLFLRALRPMTASYTFSLKARDGNGRVWGQEDKFPGDNSYPTDAWSPGDLIVEKFYPGLGPCAPADEYLLTLEVYDPKTNRVLALTDRTGSLLELGTIHADASPGNRPDDLEFQSKLDLTVAPGFQLIGATLDPSEAREGEPFSLSLFWRGTGDGKITGPISVHLQDASGKDVPLIEKAITLPSEGRGLCTLFDLRIPESISPGAAKIMVNDTQIESMNISR